LLGVLASPCLAAVRALARQRHGTADLVVPFHGLMVRRMDPAHSAIDTAVIPYHQDAFGLPPEFRFVNCWTLLSPDECGETAPGLEFIPDAVDCFLGQEANPASPHYGFLEAPHAALARYAAAY